MFSNIAPYSYHMHISGNFEFMKKKKMFLAAHEIEYFVVQVTNHHLHKKKIKTKRYSTHCCWICNYFSMDSTVYILSLLFEAKPHVTISKLLKPC